LKRAKTQIRTRKKSPIPYAEFKEELKRETLAEKKKKKLKKVINLTSASALSRAYS